VDGHIPASRVLGSAEVFRRAGGEVTSILYPGMDHTVTEEELVHVRRIVAGLEA
jgi:phospholipase/carboxylesterase